MRYNKNAKSIANSTVRAFRKRIPQTCLIALIVMSLLLIGCSKTEPSKPANTLPSASSQAVPALEIAHHVHTETVRDVDGLTILEAKIILPEIKNPDKKEGIAAINAYYQKQAEDFFTFIFSDGRERALADKADALKSGYTFRPHVYDRNLNIYYNGNNRLSVLAEQYENTGGAHPNAVWLADTFDVRTGEKLALSDILGGTKEQALEKVYQTVLAQIQQKQGTDQAVWYENYQEDVRKSYTKEDFILTENSLLVYYQLYTIAPYAAGFQKFEIPLTQKEMFAQDIGSLPSKEQEREGYFQAAMLLDRNKTILFDIFGLSMLELEIPENGVDSETLFPVVDERFTTFEELDGYLRSTYVKQEADALLANGRYVEQDGKLYGDISKDGGIGYYVNWQDYRYEISEITDRSATLVIDTTEESPAGKEDITITLKMVKEDDQWLLEEIVQ